MEQLLWLCLAAFAAGFIDAIVGGGGLVQTPATLVVLPQHPVATLLGTVKIPSFAGTFIAAINYARRVTINIKLVVLVAIIAFAASFVGSSLAASLDNKVFKPIILVILIGVAIYTYSNKGFGLQLKGSAPSRLKILLALVLALIIGFYDGFIGPGTGSFLVLLFIAVLGNDFLHASAHAKIVNLATNLASIIYFGSTGHILYQYAVPMAACNVFGSFVGSWLALRKGNTFIRGFFLFVVIATMARFAWDIFKSW